MPSLDVAIACVWPSEEIVWCCCGGSFNQQPFVKNSKRAGEMVDPLETWGDGMDHHTCRHSLPPRGARRRSQERREGIISAQWICTPRVRFLIVLHILTVNHLAHRYW